MEIRKIEQIPFYCFSVETTLPELGKYVRTKANELYQSAIALNLEIAGPVYWVYYGMDGNPDTKFKLEIGLPVHECREVDSVFQCRNLESSTFITHTLNGSWQNLPNIYAMIFAELAAKGLTHNGICREVYTYIDFNNPENNCTEVQVGCF